jgi:hypothetical protein
VAPSRLLLTVPHKPGATTLLVEALCSALQNSTISGTMYAGSCSATFWVSV